LDNPENNMAAHSMMIPPSPAIELNEGTIKKIREQRILESKLFLENEISALRKKYNSYYQKSQTS
jgi:hypothetical protein